MNRLANEISPYLLQHSSNPVDWYAWGEEAFEKARKEDKPIFLSIGYSTCHWCHVMEKESFEDETLAMAMNNTFVNIKVDREERPDIDSVYMTFCQAMTGHGGWPLTIIMTPDKKPFYSATYLPKNNRGGRIGMFEIVDRVKHLWKSDRNGIEESASELVKTAGQAKKGDEALVLDRLALDDAYTHFEKNYDSGYGGFGRAPKFPSPQNLLFLLSHAVDNPDTKAYEMASHTLKQMRFGGLFDQVGKGFHRYSTDREWLVPHFEKMLYDQAMLLIAYSEAYKIEPLSLYKHTAREIVDYLKSKLLSDQGGFFSAQDADSEGVEGKFYVWSKGDIEELLSEEESTQIIKLFNVLEDGNFEDPFVPDAPRENILHVHAPDGVNTTEVESVLFSKSTRSILKKMNDVRELRIPPFTDDKILCDWNGLMVAALSVAYSVFKEKEYLELAKKCADFVIENFYDPKGSLQHCYRNGAVSVSGLSDDYAFTLWGFIELYQGSLESKYLEVAIRVADYMITQFADSESGGFYNVNKDENELPLKLKEVYDGAYPSGNSVAVYALAKLSRIATNNLYEEIAQKSIIAFSSTVIPYPAGFSMLLLGYKLLESKRAQEVFIVVDSSKTESSDFISQIKNKVSGEVVFILVDLNEKNIDERKKLNELIPFVGTLSMKDGKPTAYVCVDKTCHLPVTNADDVMWLLK